MRATSEDEAEPGADAGKNHVGGFSGPSDAALAPSTFAIKHLATDFFFVVVVVVIVAVVVCFFFEFLIVRFSLGLAAVLSPGAASAAGRIDYIPYESVMLKYCALRLPLELVGQPSQPASAHPPLRSHT